VLVTTGSIAIPVSDPSAAGEARRAVMELARRIGFDEADRGRAGLVATEAATNIVKHAGRGEIVLDADSDEVRIIAINNGPGMEDIARCMRDGFSTAGSAGMGLGAMKRMSDSFDLWSAPGAGTVVAPLLRRRQGRLETPIVPGRFEVGAISVPYRGEVVCGDAWRVHASEERLSVAVVDGIGHGLPASEAATEALRAYDARPDDSPKAALESTHVALRSTRGAAMAIAEIDLVKRAVRFAGVGNVIASVIEGDHTKSMVSQNGTLGHAMRSLQEIAYPWPEGAVLVLHTDGLSSRWSARTYATALGKSALVLAALLYRDLARGRDDATVVVVRHCARARGVA